MTDLERLVAIEDIKRLQYRRIRAVDTKDWKTYAACHAQDMIHEAEGVKSIGVDAMVERVAKSFERRTSMHHVHSPEIDITSPTTATGIWVLQDTMYWDSPEGSHWKVGYGHYHDTYAKINGVWLYTSRNLIRDRTETGLIVNGQR